MITMHTLIHADTVSTILWIVAAAILSVVRSGRMRIDLGM